MVLLPKATISCPEIEPWAESAYKWVVLPSSANICAFVADEAPARAFVVDVQRQLRVRNLVWTGLPRLIVVKHMATSD